MPKYQGFGSQRKPFLTLARLLHISMQAWREMPGEMGLRR
jgi:hypothetical protein